MKKAKFITIEGIEGVGKSTSVKMLDEYLNHLEIQHITTREPGGTEIAEAIRKTLLDHYQESMTQDTELLLMFASRAQHIQKVIKPALADNKWVICDRFTDASFAYQGGGRKIPMDRIKSLAKWVQGDFKPDITILLNAPIEIAMARARRRGKPDRIELEEQQFFANVQATYLQLADNDPSRYRIIDASLPPKHVKQALHKMIDTILAEQ